MELFGQIDLTTLGNIVRNHPEAIKKVNFKDGEHLMLSINVSERKEPDQYGRTHYIRAGIRKDAQKDGIRYYVADLKPSQTTQATVAQPQAPAAPPADGAEPKLPF